MINGSGCAGFELIWVIVNFGKGSNVMQTAKKCGLTGGTIVLAKGTANDTFADFLGLSDIRKEIVLMVADKKMAECALEALDKKFNFSDKDEARSYFQHLRQHFIDWNYAPWESEKFQELEARIDETLKKTGTHKAGF